MEPGALAPFFDAVLGLPAGSVRDGGDPALAALLSGARANATPKVPVAADAMDAALASAEGPVLQKWFWPDARRFAVSLSHDVDEVRWSWRRRLLMGARHPRTLLEANDRYWNFDRVLELEKRFGVRSSWYFVADGDDPRDPPYRLRDVAAVMRELESKGQEVAVHGSFRSFNDGARLRRERDAVAEVLGHPVPGVRQHFANFDADRTWPLQEGAGFAYDATLTLNETSGFRAGMCHPYVPPGRRILEQPLLVMDGQLFWYERLSASGAERECTRLATDVAARGGLLTLDWHQHSYDGFSFPGWWDVYERLLGWLLERRPAILTAEQVWRWWTSRASVTVAPAERTASRMSWTVTAPEDVGGLTVRVVGGRPSAVTADVPCHAERWDAETVLVLAGLRGGEPATVTAEW